ncbi:MAG: hypothetical protein BGO76_02670 [Caedibacter sp. 38-128]|nr:hypothetical protein [Holosporales bacterium]OJX07047.1 MAG: hypothetical protein BGO76_02670 [Caedibacter sp. 38-128]
MSKNQDKRAWSAQEIEYLKVGFQMNIRLKVIAKVLKRSETSINKALSRFGIRPYGLKGRIKNNKNILSCLSEETYKKVLDNHCQELGYPSFFPVEKKQGKLLKENKLSKEKNTFPLKSYSDYHSLLSNQKSTAINFNNNWIDFESALILLKNIGDRVNCSHNNLNKKTIFINGKPFTAQQMLLRLNRLRMQSGLDPVYVANITEF